MRALATALVFLTASLALPGVVLAAPAATEEYVLDVPSAGGDDHADASGIPSSASGGSPAAAVATPTDTDAGAASGADKRDGGEEADRSGAAQLPAGSGGDPPLTALADEVSSGSGTGPLLPIVLGLTLAGALVTLIARRRRGEG